MFKHFCRYIVFVGLVFLISPMPAFSAVQAKLDRNEIHEDQTVRLIIETDDASLQGQPDLSVLNNKFNLLGTSSSQNISIVNGQQTTLKRWVTELEPKSAGSFSIPPIMVGSEKTRGLRLTVLPQSQLDTDNTRDIFVENELSPSEVYVQQQSILTIKLYLGVNILDGNLSDPITENIQPLRLSEDIQYETNVNGRQYRVVERKYALFPNASGKTVIPGIQFSGTVEDNTVQNNSVFGNLFNQGKRVRAKAKAMTLDILPPAPEFSGKYWLPAKGLEIEDLSVEGQEIIVGQPVTRRIQIRALGLSAEQLPEVEYEQSASFKQYPDKVSFNTGQKDGDVIGAATRNIVIISNNEGKLVLPELSINWWNTVKNRMETATLPAKTIEVIADSAVVTQTNQDSNIEKASERLSDPSSVDINSQPVIDQTHSSWMWLSLFLGLGWILSSLYFYERLNHAKKTTTVESNLAEVTTAEALKKIKSACTAKNPATTRSAIISWAKSIWPNESFLSLEEIANRLNNESITEHLLDLDRTMYSKQSTGNKQGKESVWQPGRLYSSIEQISNDWLKSNKSKAHVLPDLYLNNQQSG